MPVSEEKFNEKKLIKRKQGKGGHGQRNYILLSHMSPARGFVKMAGSFFWGKKKKCWGFGSVRKKKKGSRPPGGVQLLYKQLRCVDLGGRGRERIVYNINIVSCVSLIGH